MTIQKEHLEQYKQEKIDELNRIDNVEVPEEASKIEKKVQAYRNDLYDDLNREVTLKKASINGEIAAVIINGNSATLKKVKKSDEGLTLISLNPEFEPMFFTPKQVEKLPIKILGKMVELRAKF